MHVAVSSRGSASVVQTLLDHKASPDDAPHAKFPQLRSPLVLAAMSGDAETLNVLLAAKVYVNASGADQPVPLICAAQNGWLVSD